MIRRNWYPMRHSWDTSLRIGQLIPIFRQEVTPLDRWSGSSVQVGRLSPMNKPVFGMLEFETYWFFVSYQSIWNDSQITNDNEFAEIIGEDTGITWLSYTNSRTKNAGAPNLDEMFGVGCKGTSQSNYTCNAISRMCYNHIYNHFFRDTMWHPNPIAIDTSSLLLLAASKKNTYLTRATDAIESIATVTVDSSGATIDIPDITNGIEEQDWEELKERYGTDYDDVLRMMGVRMPKKYNDEPELIGYSKAPIGVSEVLNTSDTNTGEYVGHGIVTSRINMGRKMFKEYGSIVGIVCVRPRYGWKNRIDRWFNMPNLTDPQRELFNPHLSKLSHDTVYAHEMHSLATDATRDTAIGYAPKYDWLRHAENVIAGEYLKEDTWDEQILKREGADDAAATALSENQVIDPVDWDYLFQSSDDPHMFLSAFHSIGKLSQIPRSGVSFRGKG